MKARDQSSGGGSWWRRLATVATACSGSVAEVVGGEHPRSVIQLSPSQNTAAALNSLPPKTPPPRLTLSLPEHRRRASPSLSQPRRRLSQPRRSLPQLLWLRRRLLSWVSFSHAAPSPSHAASAFLRLRPHR
ncbi:hypothetical protein Droror1_Dr00017703, partial [Drosera rotundifolia]